jgi:hypothetical protein
MKFLILISLFISVSCTHMASVSQTSIPAKKGRTVSAEVEKNIIFMFNFSNSYVDEINDKLAAQCPKGSVLGILTKHENITYFPIIFHKVKITAEGYCNE